MKKKVLLMILDGWGIAVDKKVSAVDQARTPFIRSLYKKFKHCKLEASGLAVGLPAGQMGNSEVGHMNIGAGRVVYQELTRINKSIREGEFFQNAVLLEAIQKVKASGKKLHLFGLVSEGGVHSSQAHLHAILELAKANDFTEVYVHAFTDGRDCDPKSGLGFISALEEKIKNTTGHLATIIGRYYAMDRDTRWERVQEAYHLMVNGKGTPFTSAKEAIEASYREDVTDEFIKPLVNANCNGKIETGDTLICFNFRTDRPREIVETLTQKAFPDYNMTPLNVNLVTMTSYDSRFKKVKVMFEKDNLNYTLGEVLSKMDRTQIRIAETEKYPHVTFFFSGGREAEFKGESRLLVKSPKVTTYDFQNQNNT